MVQPDHLQMDVGGACCPLRRSPAEPANAAGFPVKLAEVCFPSAKNAGMDLELSHSSEHLNLAEREVSGSWDFIARGWFPSFAEDHSAVQNVRRPSPTHQRGLRPFALLQIDVEKDFVEERSEGACCLQTGAASRMITGGRGWASQMIRTPWLPSF